MYLIFFSSEGWQDWGLRPAWASWACLVDVVMVGFTATAALRCSFHDTPRWRGRRPQHFSGCWPLTGVTMQWTRAGAPVGAAADPGDGELWGRAARGDQGAFSELFARHPQAVWNHAYRRDGSWASAEDLTSNTFLIPRRQRAHHT